MATRVRVMLSLFVLLVVTCLTAVSATAVTTWPQSFSLYAGQNAQFKFEVTKPGPITVKAVWQGSGLYVSLADPSGKLVNTPTQQPSPVTVTYTATAADIQKGSTWTVIVATRPAPAPSQKPIAEGNVTVTVPAALLIPDLNRPLLDKPKIVLFPSLNSVTPSSGKGGDTVVIKGNSLPLNKDEVRVWFTIATNATLQGTIISTAQLSDGVSYTVRVPGVDWLTKSFVGSLYVRLLNSQTDTNSLRFEYVPFPLPTITSHTPTSGAPARTMTFAGTNFRMGDRVIFLVPGQAREYVGQSVTIANTTQLSAMIPVDYPTTTKTIEVYVLGVCGTGWAYGPHYRFMMDPAVVSKPK